MVYSPDRGAAGVSRTGALAQCSRIVRQPVRLPIALMPLGCVVGGSTADASPDPASQSPSRQPPLQVVVVEGEDAVNVVQQKTAVSPVVEVVIATINPLRVRSCDLRSPKAARRSAAHAR